MYAHPRRSVRPYFLFARLSTSLAVVMLALLATGTAYAQHALPGEAFYAWKIVSENAWRIVSPDPVGTDLAIAERRLNELIAVKQDPALHAQTLDAYLQVTIRLRAQVGITNQERIQAALEAQADALRELEILPQESIPNEVPSVEGTTATPTTTPLPILETPPVNPTELPQIIPTVEVLPEVLPTVQQPPEILPTAESVPEILPTVQDPLEILPTVEIPLPIP